MKSKEEINNELLNVHNDYHLSSSDYTHGWVDALMWVSEGTNVTKKCPTIGNPIDHCACYDSNLNKHECRSGIVCNGCEFIKKYK